MKNIPLLFCLMLVALGLNSCKKDDANAVEEISYGTSFGMCVGYCSNNVVITGSGKVTFSKKAHGNSPSTVTCTKDISEADVLALKALVDSAKMEKLPEVIGCPDCADGGAEFISVKLGGKLKKVMFEYGNAPEALKDLALKLREIKDGFEGCK